MVTLCGLLLWSNSDFLPDYRKAVARLGPEEIDARIAKFNRILIPPDGTAESDIDAVLRTAGRHHRTERDLNAETCLPQAEAAGGSCCLRQRFMLRYATDVRATRESPTVLSR